MTILLRAKIAKLGAQRQNLGCNSIPCSNVECDERDAKVLIGHQTLFYNTL